ncbi:hypothetical protein GCM10022631_07060 [Deinococcus rubellus]
MAQLQKSHGLEPPFELADSIHVVVDGVTHWLFLGRTDCRHERDAHEDATPPI